VIQKSRRGGRRAGSGRKTLYRPEIAQSLTAFFQERLAAIRGEGGHVNRAPSFEDFSRAKGISLETMRGWNTLHSDFMNARGTCRYLRELALEALRDR
jgi:hypothetical protein